MVRVRLPLLGVAAVLLAASTAPAQAPGPVVYPSGLHVIVVTPEISWSSAVEPADFLERLLSGDNQLVSYEADLPKDDGRIKPAPKQTAEPPSQCPADCPCETAVEFEAFPTFCCLPFAPPPPPPPSGHKCCFRRNKCCNHGGCGHANGNPYLGWPSCGMQGCASGFCSSPYAQQGCSGHLCHRGQACAPSYPGCGYPCLMCCPMPWGGMGGGCCNNDGCFGYCPPPYSCAAPSCHKCCRKHRCAHNDSPCCPRCGYPSYCSPTGSWGYPVGGWSTANDGWNGFTDPNCLPSKHHCCGLLHRCFSCKHQAPPPCPYPCWQPMCQPCMSMDCSFCE